MNHILVNHQINCDTTQYIYVHIQIYIHGPACIYIYIYTHTYIYIYIYNLPPLSTGLGTLMNRLGETVVG